MAELFKNKYRISSTRLQTWNYANAGMYFITICTANRVCHFGEIVNGTAHTQIQLTEIGETAHTEWLKCVELRPDMNLELAEFVVMPNHFHGIIMIGENKYNRGDGNGDHHGDRNGDRNGNRNRDGDNDGRDAMHRVSTGIDTPNRVPTVVTNDNPAKNKFGPQSKNLGSIIRGYKSAVTTHARKNNIAFDWQPRFHDHIIRSMDEYHRIANYILNNPRQWQKDKFYKE